jgi:hypothetical protein
MSCDFVPMIYFLDIREGLREGKVAMRSGASTLRLFL